MAGSSRTNLYAATISSFRTPSNDLSTLTEIVGRDRCCTATHASAGFNRSRCAASRNPAIFSLLRHQAGSTNPSSRIASLESFRLSWPVVLLEWELLQAAIGSHAT